MKGEGKSEAHRKGAAGVSYPMHEVCYVVLILFRTGRLQLLQNLLVGIYPPVTRRSEVETWMFVS
jgi:hypothetical protein